jgi:hypothetical protein
VTSVIVWVQERGVTLSVQFGPFRGVTPMTADPRQDLELWPNLPILDIEMPFERSRPVVIFCAARCHPRPAAPCDVNYQHFHEVGSFQAACGETAGQTPERQGGLDGAHTDRVDP